MEVVEGSEAVATPSVVASEASAASKDGANVSISATTLSSAGEGACRKTSPVAEIYDTKNWRGEKHEEVHAGETTTPTGIDQGILCHDYQSTSSYLTLLSD